MGLGPGSTAGGPYGPIVPGAPRNAREPPLEQQYKKHSRTSVPCSVCGKIIPAKQAKVRDNKVYCEKCFITNADKSPRTYETDASSQHMIR